MKRILATALVILGSLSLIQAQNIMNIYQSNGTVIRIPLSSIDSITYTINPPAKPTVSTAAVRNISQTGAATGGYVSKDGGAAVTQRGVCYGTSPAPTIAGSKTSNGSDTGVFNSTLTGLTANTTYYIRAYATNSIGTAYGNEVSFKTSAAGIVSNPGAGVVFAGYNYPSVVLGNGQEWLARNLQNVVFANGDTIPNVKADADWFALTTPGWVHYNNDTALQQMYGKLYNWYAITDSRNVCPKGWHVPTKAEWTKLTDYLGNESVAGGKMKATGTSRWQSPNTDATNESGFAGLPGGARSPDGFFSTLRDYGYWWSATASGSTDAWLLNLAYNSGTSYLYADNKGNAYSVRCIKD